MKYIFTFLAFVLMSTGFAQIPEYVSTDGLVAWYPFSGDASDLSESGNDGAIQGPFLTTDRFGNESSAYGFDGVDDYILIEGSDALEFEDGDLTFSGWFQTSVSKRQWVVSNYLTYGNNPLWMLGVPHNGTLNSIGYDVRDGINQIGENITNSEVVDGFWHHSVFVRSGHSIELYLDGVSIYNLEVSNLSALTEGNPYYIGTDNLNFQCWEGAIDDIGFWNRSLTESEILGLYLSGQSVHGCTDQAACNFNPEATEDDDSCLYAENLEPILSVGPNGAGLEFISNTSDGSVVNWSVESMTWDSNEASIVVSTAFSSASGYTFNGNDYILIQETEYEGGDFTIDFEAVIPQFEPGELQMILKSQKPNLIVGTGPCFCTSPDIPDPDDNPLIFMLRRPSGGWNGVDLEAPSDNLPHRYTVAYQAQTGTMSLFMDGILRAEHSFQGDFHTATGQSLVIGANTGEEGACFEGSVQYVHFYGERLNDEQIGNGPGCEEPIPSEVQMLGQWDFEVNNGSIALDSSPFGNDGEVQGALFGNVPSSVSCSFDCAVTDTLVVVLEPTTPAAQGNCGPGTHWDLNSQECVVSIPSDTDFDGCVSMVDLLDLLTVFGTCQEVVTSEWMCGDLLEYQGYDYATVQIGEQCWFAENMRSENYENGELIPANLGVGEWSQTNAGAVAVYGDEGSACDSFVPSGNACDANWSIDSFGRLYNWHTVVDSRKICPINWHVPDKDEWSSLAVFLGGDEVAGSMMKSSLGWFQGLNGSDPAGFGGAPGGYRDADEGFFFDAGYGGYFWSSSNTDGYPSSYILDAELDALVNSNSFTAEYGFSIRCIQDSE